MSAQTLTSIFWRQVNKATVDTLIGESPGQYHIAIPHREALVAFFDGLERTDPTARGGFTLKVPLAAYDGPNAVAAQFLDVRFMGPQSARADWNIPSQRPETAYPLWRVGRAFNTPKTAADYDSLYKHHIVLCRDARNNFHARWLTPADLDGLPNAIRVAVMENETGVLTFAAPEVDSSASAIRDRLLKHHNVLLYGPPGTGKSFLMQQVALMFAEKQVSIDTSKEHAAIGESTHSGNARWVTFHQSYSYEEFVLGLRADNTGDKLLNLKPQAGVLLELAASAKNGEPSLLLIDELNRGNVSRIFGEFITVMEADKRLTADGKRSPTTVAVRLPYIPSGDTLEVTLPGRAVQLPNPFEMPHGVYTLASMNSVDKSVAPLDSALRRRFHVIALLPDLGQLARRFGSTFDPTQRIAGVPATTDQVRQLSLQVFDAINSRLAALVGEDYCLGQWYLTPVFQAMSAEEGKDALEEVFLHRVLPQLRELFHGRTDRLSWVLDVPDDPGDDNLPFIFAEPDDELRSIGGLTRLDSRQVNQDDLLKFLSGITPNG